MFEPPAGMKRRMSGSSKWRRHIVAGIALHCIGAEQAGAAESAMPATAAPAAISAGGGPAAAAAKAKAAAKTERELQVVTMQMMIAPMFESKGTQLFGTGPAGRHWQALMTEHVARAVVTNGKVSLVPLNKNKADGKTNAKANATQVDARRVAAATACRTPGCRPWITSANFDPELMAYWSTSVDQVADIERGQR